MCLEYKQTYTKEGATAKAIKYLDNKNGNSGYIAISGYYPATYLAADCEENLINRSEYYIGRGGTTSYLNGYEEFAITFTRKIKKYDHEPINFDSKESYFILNDECICHLGKPPCSYCMENHEED